MRIISIPLALLFSTATLATAQPLPPRLVDADIRGALDAAPLSRLFEGESPKDAERWQNGFRFQLEALLGDSAPPAKWRAVEEERAEFDDHTRYALLLEAETDTRTKVDDGIIDKGPGPPIPSLPLYLLVPKNLKPDEKAPAVLCVHGHGLYGNDPIVGRTDIEGVAENIQKHNYDYGLQFVRRGYVVAAPCMIPFGRRVDREKYRGNDPCAVAFVRMQALGRLAITENLRDLRWSLDLLQSRAEVDGLRLGCAGLSYGGRMTMLVSAVDLRIRVAAVSGALNLMQERMSARHSCGAQMIPGLLIYGDYSEIGSLIAPRPCVWETGSTDTLVVPEWDDLFRERLQKIYKAHGAEEHLKFDHFQGGHQWSGQIAFPLFDEVLKP